MECCKAWDDNELLFELSTVHVRRDAFPVAPGHALIIPKRHVVSVIDCMAREWEEIRDAMDDVRCASDTDDFTIAINEGRLAGRQIHHLHVHMIPRRKGDMDDPRGGVRRMFLPVMDDPWLAR